MSPPTCQALSRFTQPRFAFWPRRNIRPSRLPRGHQFHPTPHAGRSVFLVSTPSSPSLTVFSPALLPTHTTATSTFFYSSRIRPSRCCHQALPARRIRVTGGQCSESYRLRQSCRPAIFRPPWLPTRCRGVDRVPRRLPPPVRHAQTTPQ